MSSESEGLYFGGIAVAMFLMLMLFFVLGIR